MGLDSTICYRLVHPGVNLTPARAFLASIDVRFGGINSHYTFTPDGRLEVLLGLPPDMPQTSYKSMSMEEKWQLFAQAAQEGLFSLNSSMHHKEFHFTLGYTVTSHGTYILLQFEDNDIYDMGQELPTYDLNARQVFTRLFQAFSAQAMVYARDVYFEDLLAYLHGVAVISEPDDAPLMLIGVTNATADLLYANGGQDLTVDGTAIISRNFFGAPNIV